MNWLFTFIVALTAEFMMKGLGIGKMCFIFSLFLSICTLILLKGIPNETQMENLNSLKQPLQLKLKPEEIELYTS